MRKACTTVPYPARRKQVGAIPVTEGGAGYVPITTAEGTLDTDDALTFDGTTLSTDSVYASGGVYTEGSVHAEGDISAEGSVSASSIYTEGSVSADGDISAGGSVSASSIYTEGSVHAEGDISAEGSVHADVGMTIAGRAVEVASAVAATHSAATLTLTAAHHNQRIPVDTSSNSVEVRIVDTLPAAFSCELRKTSASNAITFASGGGYITPVEYGTASNALNAITSIFVESASHAETITVEPS